MKASFGKGGAMSNRRNRKIQTLIRAEIEKGQRSENQVEEALQALVISGEIHHYYRAEPRGELDRQGIDFLVFLQPSTIAPLQVKSSALGKESHVNEYRDTIPCVVVDPFSTSSKLSETILQELGLSVKFLEPVLVSMARERFNQFPALI